MIQNSIHGSTGYLKLDRPKALNALNMEMIDQLSAGLQSHLESDSVQQVVVCAAHEGAFCAGGDVKHIRALVLDGEIEEAAQFFEREYALNLSIAKAGKAYIALMDGASMGGGIGISAHGSHRIVTERAMLAMPETAIGLFPDVGGSYFLPRLKYHAGYWMGLSGARISGAEAVVIGLATHLIRSADVGVLLERLEQGERIDAVLDELAVAPDDEGFLGDLEAVDHVFGADDLETATSRLDTAIAENPGNRLLKYGHKGISHGSPHSLQVTFDLLKAGENDSIESCLAREFATVIPMIQHPDFAEGVRAMLVDKDRSPVWS